MINEIILDANGFSQEEYEDVRRCLETLLSIRAGSQPLDREMGIDFDGIVGFPADVAENMLSMEMIEKVERYEPRVEVDSIEFERMDGVLRTRIHFIRTKEG